MDPLRKIFPEIQDLIFQHWTTDEVLECSTVSKFWYKTIGNSQCCMSKIWVDVGDRFNEPSKTDNKAFRVSQRKYENFKISEMENGLQILLFPRRRWKRAKIDIQSFLSFNEYVNLLKIANDSLIDLEIFDMDIDESENQCEGLKFNELMRLKISSVTLSAVIPFNQPLNNLKKLIIDDIRTNEETLIEFINCQSNLTHLGTSSKFFFMLSKRTNNCKVNLEFLHVEQNHQEFPKHDDESLSDLHHFISTQSQLKWIVLSDWTCETSFHEFYSLPNIERISIEYFDADAEKIQLETSPKSNKSLARIDFECEDMKLDWINSVLQRLVDIKILYFFHISMDLLKILSTRKNLECIKFCSIFDGYLEILDQPEHRHLKFEEEKYFDYRNII